LGVIRDDLPAGDGGTGVDSVSVSDVDSVCELMREVVERIEIFAEMSRSQAGVDGVLDSSEIAFYGMR
jgi:hypothetical protein